MDKENIVPILCGVFFIILLVGVGAIAYIDEVYKFPQAAENANQICQEKGFDYYEDFERIGFLSTKPVAIKCKYVTNYQEMDIELRQTFGGFEE